MRRKFKTPKKFMAKNSFNTQIGFSCCPQALSTTTKKNFITFFNIKENEFAGKKVLDTGCGRENTLLY